MRALSKTTEEVAKPPQVVRVEPVFHALDPEEDLKKHGERVSVTRTP